MRIAICDDLKEERARLAEMVREYCQARELSAEIAEFEGGEALLSAFEPGMFSLVFLDIYMDGMTGVEAARGLKSIDPNSVIVFTTTSREHGAEAFDLEAFHYLVKPIERGKLFFVLGKWYDALCRVRTVPLKCGRAVREVYIRDILYVDVQGRSSTVHTAAERIETSMPLFAVEELLPAGEFIRPIRYCLAALSHIQTVTEGGVLLDNGETLAAARQEKENLRRQLAAYRLRALRGR